MKKIILAVALFIGVSSLHAQATKQLNMGVGLNTGGLPIYLGYEIPIASNITISPMVSFNLDGFDYLIPAIKADYYFDTLLGLPSSFDFYGGANFGYIMGLGAFSPSSDFDFGLELGGRWFWSDKFGLNLEFSGGNSFGSKFGLTMRI